MSRPRKPALPPAQDNIEKLQKLIEGGNCYGAQQMYKSISARYVSAERYSEALDILESGACLQLKHDQFTCGAELAASFVDTLVKGKFPYNNEMLGKFIEAFPRNAVPDHVGDDDDDMQKLTDALAAAKIRVEGCSSFLKASLRRSIEFGSPKGGSPEWHPLRWICPKFHTILFVRIIQINLPQYLLTFWRMDANFIMDEVKKQVESKDLEFPKSELTELIVYLLQTLERDALPLFRLLRQNYKSCIDRDPTFNELLDDIAERFYGVRRKNPMEGMFGDIFKMMGDMPM